MGETKRKRQLGESMRDIKGKDIKKIKHERHKERRVEVKEGLRETKSGKIDGIIDILKYKYERHKERKLLANERHKEKKISKERENR